MKTSSSHFLFFLALALSLFAGAGCNKGLGPQTPSSTGVGQILIRSKPPVLFGNGGTSEIQVTTNQIPDGSTVEVMLTGSNLPDELRGCLLNGNSNIINGQASASYIAGILLGSGIAGANEPVATLNVAAKVTMPNGTQESRSGMIILNGVDLIPPDNIDNVLTNTADNPNSIFLQLVFQTIGIPPGTPVTFSISRPDLGNLNLTSAPVEGSEESGTATIQYNTKNNTGGTQVVTATIVFPNPHDIDPTCLNIAEADRTLIANVKITQDIPPPPKIMVTADPNMVMSGDQATITAQTTNLPLGTPICFVISPNSTPASSIKKPVCVGTDGNGQAQAVLAAANVTSTQVVVIRAFADLNGNMMLDGGTEPSGGVSVTISAPMATPSP